MNRDHDARGPFAHRRVRRAVVLFPVVGLLFAAAAAVLNFGIDNSVSVWFPEDDPALLDYRQALETFGPREWMFALVEPTAAGAALDAAELEHLVERWIDQPDVHRVVPAATALDGAPAGAFLVEVTNDLDTHRGYREALVDDLRGATVGLSSISGVRLAGTPVINGELNRAARRDMMLFFPAVTLFVALVGFLLFGNERDTAVLLAICLGTVTATLGALLATGTPLNMVTIMLPTILIALSVADVVHLVQSFHAVHRDGSDALASAWSAARAIAAPCAGTTLTTAAGFLALSGSSVAPVRQLAFFASGGIALAWALSVTLGPLLLARLWDGRARRTSAGLTAGGRALEALNALLARRPGRVAAVWAVAGVSLFGLRGLEADTDYVRFFRDGTVVPSDYRAIEAAGLPQTPILGMLRSAEKRSGEGRPDAAFAPFIEGLWGIRGVGAVIPSPEPRDDARQVLILADSSNSAHLTGVSDRTHAWAADALPAGATWVTTGTGLLWAHMDEGVIRTQRESLLFVTLACFAVFLLLFRSLAVALLGVFASLLPVAMGLGWMGALGVPVNMATVLIAGIAVGLAVDDTIHLLFAVQHGRRRGLALGPALDGAVHEVGLRMVVTSAVLVGAFVSMGLSDFLPTAHFGLFSSLTIALALTADLTLLPVLIRLHGWIAGTAWVSDRAGQETPS
jgi:predicted RND superfamily exporter protein